ncbi:MAG TPA: peptide-methionine (S)-S-oxide reductase MsrA [Methanospirillum sp.]|nr:peptide-methionine (S)-S-oxide reductase MsrA [Methanospirillum sp.]
MKTERYTGRLVHSPMMIATFAAGCFWGVEAAFQQVHGVLATRVGYTGGDVENPTYEEICSDKTGHVEAVQIEYDPGQVTYQELLNHFFTMHDPTQENRQGPDIGSQYRSVIFFHSEEQEQEATRAIEELSRNGRYNGPIVTAIVRAGPFWQAEEYHQSYILKMGRRYGGL